jgi:hypothetical protein
MNKCSICGKDYSGMGHNAKPVNDGRCCGPCNAIYVISSRMLAIFAKPEPKVDSKPCILVVGNPIDGFKFYGPFDHLQDAVEFSEGVDGENWVADLIPDTKED